MQPVSIKKRELAVHRTMPAPREKLWAAFTNARLIDQWWGPDGFRNMTKEMDVREGGIWRHVMHGPDGAQYPNRTVYRQLLKPSKLVLRNEPEGGASRVKPFDQIVTFDVLGAKTDVKMHLVFDSPEELKKQRRMGAAKGGKQTLLRLERFLRQPQLNHDTMVTVMLDKPQVVVERTFDAEPGAIFAALTDPEAIVRWWGPREMITSVSRIDVREGGKWRFVHRDPLGALYGFHGEYQEIDPPFRIVYTFNYEGMPPGHESFISVNLDTLEDGRTKMTQTADFASHEDRDAMVRIGMEAGAREGMDRLAELLRSL